MDLNIRRILVPNGFGTLSERTVEYAASVAATFGAAVRVLHVLDNLLQKVKLGALVTVARAILALGVAPGPRLESSSTPHRSTSRLTWSSPSSTKGEAF